MEAGIHAAAIETAVSDIETRGDTMMAALHADPYDEAAQAIYADARAAYDAAILDLKRLTPDWTEFTGEVLPE
jgi:hypothetical protein